MTMQSWDVIIQSKSLLGLSLACRLKEGGAKVAWVLGEVAEGNTNDIAGEAIPYFLGAWPHALDSLGYQLTQDVFFTFRNPFGFSLMTPWGPMDYQQASPIQWIQHRSGYSEQKKVEWLMTPIFFQNLNAWQKKSMPNLTGQQFLGQEFLILQPKVVSLRQLLDFYQIQVIDLQLMQKESKNFIMMGHHQAQYILRLGKVTEEQPIWKWVKVHISAEFKRPISLPYQTTWWDERMMLPFGEAFFILIRNPLNEQSFDLYFRLPPHLLDPTQLSDLVNELVALLKRRLPGFMVRFADFMELPFEILHQQKSWNFADQRRLLDFTWYHAESWSLHDLFAFEKNIFQWLMPRLLLKQ